VTGVALGVGHGADVSVREAGDEGVTHAEGTAVHENGGHGTATAIELGLEHVPRGEGVGIGLELEDVGLEKHGLEQLVDADLLLCGDVDEHVLATPLLGDDTILDELLADAAGVGTGLVDLVDGHDDGYVGSLGVMDGLDGLGHDAVVGGDDQDDDVGDLGTTGRAWR